MTEPERIWVIKGGHGRGRDMVSTLRHVWGNDPTATEYIRADKAAALAEALREAEAELRTWIKCKAYLEYAGFELGETEPVADRARAALAKWEGRE